MPNLLFNILTFNHPQEEQVFFFTDQEQENLTRIHKTLVPKEVIEKYGEQEHYLHFIYRRKTRFFSSPQAENGNWNVSDYETTVYMVFIAIFSFFI